MLATRMVAHFAIEVAFVLPVVPDNDCLNRAHKYIHIYTHTHTGTHTHYRNICMQNK